MNELDVVLGRYITMVNSHGWMLALAPTVYDGHHCLVAEVSTPSGNLRVSAYNLDGDMACRTAINKMAQLNHLKVNL